MAYERFLKSKLLRGVITFINALFLANRDYPYHDYHSATTGDDYQAYTVGSNNKDLAGDQHKLFISKSTLIMCTEDVYVKLNHANNVVQTLLADTWYTFKSNVRIIHFADVLTEGTIYIYMEGVLPQEQRSPE